MQATRVWEETFSFAIDTEVNKALNFEFPIGKYGILTTAKVSTDTQKKVLEINRRHRTNGQFEVELLSWGTLCRLLQKYDEVRIAYFESMVVTAGSRIGSKSPIVIETIREASIVIIGVDLTVEIDEARDAVNRREFQVALLLLNRIRQRSDFDSATAHDRFRISSNLGAAEMGLRRPDAAAKHFLEAVRFEPTDERARINEVFAYILKGDNETAYVRATALRTEYPASTKLAANWVVASPHSATVEDFERELSDEIRSDAEVALALSRRALLETKISVALSYAETAARALPQSSQPSLLIARATMGWIVQAEKGLPDPGMDRSELEQRVEARIADAIAFSVAEHDSQTQSEALALRADLRMLQNSFDEAEADASEALRLDPENIQPLLALSHLRGVSKRIDESIELLERAYRKGARPEAAVMYGRALLQRGAQDDVQVARNLLTAIDLTQLRPEFRSVVVASAVNTMLFMTAFADAKEYLATVAAHVRSELVAVLRGHVSFAEGNQDEANVYAIQARTELSEDSELETRESVARLLVKLGELAEALPLFQELFKHKMEAFDWGQLLDCASRLRRDDVVMETCAELRRRGKDPWEVVSFEVQYLQKYSREKAVARLDDFLKTHPGHKLALLMRSIIGVQSRQTALVTGDIDKLPLVEDLPLDCIMPAVQVLRFAGSGNSAVDYAYRYLRLHFDDIRAHEAILASLIPFDPSITIPAIQEVVEIGSAVCVYDDFNNVLRWFVLEQTDKPNANFEEITADGSLAQELIGKRVGDSVLLARGQMQSRTGTIRQIMPKYVRRFQDVMGEISVRFGAKSSVESMHIGSTEEETAKAMQKVLDSVKQRQVAITQVRRVYDELPMSLHLFGDRFGKNAYIGLASLAQEKGQFVKNTFGTPEERTQATLALQTASHVVVDLTAVATVRLIGVEHLLLNSKRFRYQMSERTFNELQETLVGDLFSGATSATISYRDGVPSISEETPEQKADRRTKDEEFLEKVKAAVEIVPVLGMSAVDPSKRAPLEEMFGQYGAESMLLAANPDSVLWTDDLLQAEMARNEFGAKRTWTELVAQQSALALELAAGEKERVVASLIGMEYSVTPFDSAVMLTAVEIADGIPWRTPLKQIVEIFRKPTGNLQGLLGIFVEFIVKLYRAEYLPETRCKVVTALLDALWETVPLRLALLRLRRASSQIFGLNTVGQQQFDLCFDRWYAGKPDKVIGI